MPVFEQLRYEIMRRLGAGEDLLPGIQGREKVKGDVIRTLLSSTHPYLVSVEGTGKTRLARSLAELLGPVPRIGGCPYNDDPKWPRESLCPRCRASADPVREFGVEWITGEERFSRVQGNEYTNESKLLGLKDIQAIASGLSPDDPRTFTGTGVFRANRGLLFVDELPAIRTKVQVLLHPIIEEKKSILEEYGWEYPLDLCVVATGNPEGFSHVNEVPRPLMDRFETIYMDLPEEEVEFAIMLMERSGRRNEENGTGDWSASAVFADVTTRKSLAPWWLLRVIVKAARQSRSCRWLERASSIRGTARAHAHAYSSAELAGHPIVTLEDVSAGLKLALRGRVQLRQDLIDFENPRETLAKADELSDDLIRAAMVEMADGLTSSWDKLGIMAEAERLVALPREAWPGFLKENSRHFRETLTRLERMGGDELGSRMAALDDGSIESLIKRDSRAFDSYLLSAVEFILSLSVVEGWLLPENAGGVYVPREIAWTSQDMWR